MKALILAGGRGTRLRPLTYSIAKQLIRVANKPILEYVLDDIEDAGIRDVGIIISPETGDQIKNELSKNARNLEINYILQEEPLGLAHTVLIANNFLGQDPFVMYLGDNLIQGGIKNIINVYHKHNADCVIMLKEVKNPSLFGVANVSNNGRVTELIEKPSMPSSNYAIVGIYVFSPLIHEAVSKIRPSGRGELEITDAIQFLIASGKNVRSIILDKWWFDTGSREDLIYANRIILDSLVGQDSKLKYKNCSVTGNFQSGEDNIITGSELIGPVVIGNNVKIENSNIGPYVSIDYGCEIINSHIENSIIYSNSRIKNINALQQSIIGRDCILEGCSGLIRTLNITVGDNSQLIL